MTSGTGTESSSNLQLVQQNKLLQSNLGQLRHKTELYKIGLGNISKILRDIPKEFLFKPLTNSDKLRSSFNLTAHLIIQKKALERIGKVVDDLHNNATCKEFFGGLPTTLQAKTTVSLQNTSTTQNVNSQSRLTVSACQPDTLVNRAAITIPTSTLSIQKSIIKMAPPPPIISKRNILPEVVTPPVFHQMGQDSSEIQIRIETNPIEKHASFLDKDKIFKRDFFIDQDILFRRRGRGRPPTRIPNYTTSARMHMQKGKKHGRMTSPMEEQFRMLKDPDSVREEEMAWQCLERVYASHHQIKDRAHCSSAVKSFHINRILGNAPMPTIKEDKLHNQHRSQGHPHSLSPIYTNATSK